MFKPFMLGLAAALTGFAGCNHRPTEQPPSKKAAPAAGEIGSRLPDFDLKDLAGHPISSVDLHGKVVLVDFWATWCQPCKKEMPGYQKLADRYGSHGFAVLGFKSEVMRDTEDPLQFAGKIGVRYPLVIASEGIPKKFGDIVGLPTTMLYDRQGILRMKVIGFEYTDTIEASIKPLL
jgi:thiol-disulfide isomerase/thioredoxin